MASSWTEVVLPARWRPSRPKRGTIVDVAITCVSLFAVWLCLLLGWQWAYDAEYVSNLVLPSPSATWDAFKEGVFGSGTYWSHIWVTTWATLLAVGIGVAIGIAGGALFAFVPIARRALYPFVLVGMAFPKIAVAPLFVLWFGYGLSSKVAVGASIAFFPVLANAATGLREINKDETELFRAYRATMWQELRFLRVPRAVSYILPSLDVAIVGALLGVIAGEFVASTEGLGFLVLQYSKFGDAPNVFAVLFCMAIVGLALKGLAVVLSTLGPKNVTPR
ncbi:ABC transporter permease subunit [Nocardioides sp. LMS-CY]|uniref:NitT/TauT family transport system permease protein n=1 Tax=Nocardioides soli TaxID=1036020 RepID=A0A7W4YZX6_9ACTN|nr:ABC transporter permease [Nocardioides sp. LMS-CY]MBB3041689.1 NitT/TauT family transport system permease protein [Nocardioides soli]QWF21218.1 ABC transporter permease subunit [Nocardioides sp. LMS-CY]